MHGEAVVDRSLGAVVSKPSRIDSPEELSHYLLDRRLGEPQRFHRLWNEQYCLPQVEMNPEFPVLRLAVWSP